MKNSIKSKIKIKYSFTFAFLLSYFYLNIPNESEPIMHFSSGIFILALLVLCCFTNVIGYLSSIIFLKYYKIGDKYPKLSKVLVYFEKTNFILDIYGSYYRICLPFSYYNFFFIYNR